MPKSSNERVKQWRARKLAAGKVQFGPVWVSQETKDKLKKLVETNENAKPTDP